jgi:hypothetical protein
MIFKGAGLGKKLGGGFGLVLGLLLVVLGGSQVTIADSIEDFDGPHQGETAIGSRAAEVRSIMLQCRRDQESLLMSLDKKHMEKIGTDVALLKKEAQALLQIGNKTGYKEVTAPEK